jgi:hypothetical protein
MWRKGPLEATMWEAEAKNLAYSLEGLELFGTISKPEILRGLKDLLSKFLGISDGTRSFLSEKLISSL